MEKEVSYMEHLSMNSELYTLDDVYFDLENTKIVVDRIYSLIKFAHTGYEEIGSIDALDYYSLVCSIEDKVDKLSESLEKITKNLEK